MADRIQPEDHNNIQKFFGAELKALNMESFKAALRSARKKFHPDNFAKFEDETVMEMAKERFQTMEVLAAKVEAHLQHQAAFGDQEAEPAEGPNTGYTTEGIKLDIMTMDKQLKFVLFKSPVIYRGDYRKIPGTRARIISMEDYQPRMAAGFRDNVKIELRFGVEDPIQEIVHWLWRHISEKTSKFVIEGKSVSVNLDSIRKAIKQEARLELPGR
ncbi:MAG: hypothetical protein AAFV07_04060 [Bacteroidota bacterium]